MNSIRLTREEQTIHRLRSLYEEYGYAKFKMSKFEEYDLYVRNKDFLVSDGIITFTDTNGKLMALKPDVTLSIIKNSRSVPGCVDKVYYDENVYRVSSDTGTFKEIRQLGVECIGEVDTYGIYEVLSLAAKSLRIVSQDAILDLSHFGILTDLIDSFGVDPENKKKILRAVSEKNQHDLARICENCGVPGERLEVLSRLIAASGAAKDVFPEIFEILAGEKDTGKISEFMNLCDHLCERGFSDMIRVDFSVVNGMDYYNGIVFRGFVKGIPTWILSGGQYDRLMRKLDQSAGAIGFALYLDLMDDLLISRKDFDVDCLVLYDEKVPFREVDLVLNKMVSEGKSVTAQKRVPEKCAYRELWKLSESGVELLERNA